MGKALAGGEYSLSVMLDINSTTIKENSSIFFKKEVGVHHSNSLFGPGTQPAKHLSKTEVDVDDNPNSTDPAHTQNEAPKARTERSESFQTVPKSSCIQIKIEGLPTTTYMLCDPASGQQLRAPLIVQHFGEPSRRNNTEVNMSPRARNDKVHSRFERGVRCLKLASYFVVMVAVIISTSSIAGEWKSGKRVDYQAAVNPVFGILVTALATHLGALYAEKTRVPMYESSAA